jgi:hypothetical protein
LIEDDDALAAAETEEPFDLTEFEEEDLVESEGVAPVVSYSGQDFDVAGLVRRLDNEDILIPSFGHEDDRIQSAGFQRAFVWNRPQMDRFIESLLLGYPIPGIFLVRQADRRYLVLDGQQRLRTLAAFYRGIDMSGREFRLKNVSDSLQGVTYATLTDELRRLLDDAFIQATIVPTDGSSQSLEAIYQVFERLNSGGTQLTPHEIRVALFAGPFIDYLEQLNRIAAWRSLYGKKSPRVRDQELVLRILALYFDAGSYKRPLKRFLNDFAAANRDMGTFNAKDALERFKGAAELLDATVGKEGLRRTGYQLNAALTEAVFVGLMRRLDERDISPQSVSEAVSTTRSDEELQMAISRATSDEENVRIRLEVATSTFREA